MFRATWVDPKHKDSYGIVVGFVRDEKLRTTLAVIVDENGRLQNKSILELKFCSWCE